jgi:hypothetical protein
MAAVLSIIEFLKLRKEIVINIRVVDVLDARKQSYSRRRVPQLLHPIVESVGVAFVGQIQFAGFLLGVVHSEHLSYDR